MAIFDRADVDLVSMVLDDDLQDYGDAYEPVEVPGTGSSVLIKYRQVLTLPHLSLSPAGANPRNVIAGGQQVPLAVWVLSLPRGTNLDASWLVKTTIGIGDCESIDWWDIVGPEHPRSSAVLSRWLVSKMNTPPKLV